MLNRLIGTEPVEVAKSAAIAFLALIGAVALQQLAASRSGQTAVQADRSEVLQVAASFGQELTTYDYAHPDVQANRLAPLATRPVLDRVERAVNDVVQYRAVSVGQPPDAYLQTIDSGSADVLLQTRSTIESQYTPPGITASGLLACRLRRDGSRWRVYDYKWLTPVTESVSYATRDPAQ